MVTLLCHTPKLEDIDNIFVCSLRIFHICNVLICLFSWAPERRVAYSFVRLPPDANDDTVDLQAGDDVEVKKL